MGLVVPAVELLLDAPGDHAAERSLVRAGGGVLPNNVDQRSRRSSSRRFVLPALSWGCGGLPDLRARSRRLRLDARHQYQTLAEPWNFGCPSGSAVRSISTEYGLTR